MTRYSFLERPSCWYAVRAAPVGDSAIAVGESGRSGLDCSSRPAELWSPNADRCGDEGDSSSCGLSVLASFVAAESPLPLAIVNILRRPYSLASGWSKR